jgi:hypothetical protein
MFEDRMFSSVGGSTPSQKPSWLSKRPLFHVPGSFQAAARPLVAAASSRGCRRTLITSALAQTSLAELSEGPYFIIAQMLDAPALAHCDASTRLLRTLNRADAGPWRLLGARDFKGLELDQEGLFESEQLVDGSPIGFEARKQVRVDWKGRYGRFKKYIATFRAPFIGSLIEAVTQPDEVAYCRCRLRSDILNTESNCGVYLEVEVDMNPDNLSLAIVDFEAGGRSSVTFSPDTGAVIRERKVRESPRKVEGAYIQPLPATRPGKHFEGAIGLYIFNGHLAFFRRCSAKKDSQQANSQDNGLQTMTEAGKWESTGFITDLAWAEGRRLTPCLAFRDEGMYRVRFTRLGTDPPHRPQHVATAYHDRSWNGLDWEAQPNGDAQQ